jgi:hypothetical protein
MAPRAAALSLALLALWLSSAPPARAQRPSGESCPEATGQDLLPPPQAHVAGHGGSAAAVPPSQQDYRHQLSTTPYGWPRRDHWCVWLEPVTSEGPAARWDQAWLEAVKAALARWSELVPIEQVSQPEQAQVRILRRRPPLRGGRASHGRAELQLAVVERQQQRQLEPRVLVQISPGQRSSAMQATALHELGHAFGLWGHSDQAADAMAAVPGATPVLELSPRDRATFLWLQQQPSLQPAPPPAP